MLKINPEKTVLLFFDMLNGHIKTDNPDTQARFQSVIPNAVALLNAARKHQLMVAYAHANHRDDNGTTASTIRDRDNYQNPLPEDYVEQRIFGGGTWESSVIDELAPRPEDYLVPKYRWNAFFQTYLELALRTRGIDTIILSGGSTDVGVASTAYMARDLDYNIIFASDACSSHQMDCHTFLMDRVFPRMGRVRTTAEIVALFPNPS